MANDDKNYVTTKTMAAAFAMIAAAIGWLFVANSTLASRVESQSTEYIKIQQQLSQIQTDLVWIKSSISNRQ